MASQDKVNPLRPPGPDDIFDMNTLFDRVDHDLELLKEMMDLALENLPRQVEMVRHAAAWGDANRLQSSAHAVKGTFSAFSANRAASAAYRLETMARLEQLTGLAEALGTFEKECELFTQGLKALEADLPDDPN